MKNFTSIGLLILILLMGGNYAEALTDTVSLESLPVDNLDFKNPFVSLLPKKEIIKREIEKPIVPEPVAKEIEKDITPPNLIIKGLVWNSNRPQAIINESVVGVGDTVEEAKITAITRTGIDILFEGKHFTVSPNELTVRNDGNNFDSRPKNRLR